MEALAKYLVAVIKLNSNDEDSIRILQDNLKKLVHSEIDACLEIVEREEKEWGECAIRVNKITGNIKRDLLKRKNG